MQAFFGVSFRRWRSRTAPGLAMLGLMALVAALPALPAGPARAASDDEPIDCSETPFVFSGQGFFVDCLRINGRAAKDGASGETRSDLISITSEDRSMFLTVVSVRLTATRLYLRRQDLREGTRDFFNSIELDGWNGLGNKNGYDTAEFKADISGQPSHCLAIQRYMNPIETGFKRRVIGIGCASGGLDIVYDALSKLQAPGD